LIQPCFIFLIVQARDRQTTEGGGIAMLDAGYLMLVEKQEKYVTSQ